MKYAVGMDLAFTNVGVALFTLNKSNKLKFKDCRVISTVKNSKGRVSDDNIARIIYIIKELNIMFKVNKINLSKDKVFFACEFPFGGARSQKAVQGMSLITGAIATYIEIHNLQFVNIAPIETKSAIYGRKLKPVEQKTVDKKYIVKKVMQGLSKYKNYINLVIDKKAKLEHFCDAVGALLWAKNNTDEYKIFLDK